MKKIVLLAMLLYNFQIYGQQSKDVGLDQKVFFSEFTADDRATWPQVNNEFYFFLVKDNSYIVECTNSEKKAYLLPKGGPKLDTFKVEAEILADKNKSDDGVAGIALDIQDKLSGGYLVEINNKKQYRIVSVDGNGSYSPLSNNAKGGGWVNFKTPKGKDYIKLSTTQTGKNVSVQIDDMDVFKFDNPLKNPGQTGIFISGPYKTRVQHFAVYKTKNTGNSDNQNQTEQKNTQEINAFNNALLSCKQQNKELSEKLETSNQEIAQVRKKNQDLQTYISQNLDIKLQEEVKKEKEKADILEAENKKLKSEMEDQQTLKKTIEQNKDGDLILALSGNLKKEQQKNADLEKRIKELTLKKKPTKKTQ